MIWLSTLKTVELTEEYENRYIPAIFYIQDKVSNQVFYTTKNYLENIIENNVIYKTNQ